MPSTQQILGIRFLDGDVDSAVEWMSQHGGYLVAPSGTCFARLRRDVLYREAVTRADLAIPDSGAMVLFWKFLRGGKLPRISGLRYIQQLAARLLATNQVGVMWVLPNDRARAKTSQWLSANRFPLAAENFYVAPHYRSTVEDQQLAAQIEKQKPKHVIIGIGSGPQEKLGLFLRENLSYRPAIHCIGAALGFLTGDQIAIPDWADRFYLGWLLRLFAQPRVFIPRLTRALQLPWLIFRYAEELPPLRLQPDLGSRRSDIGGQTEGRGRKTEDRLRKRDW